MLIPVALVYPFDPLGTKIGGMQTFIKGFIRHAPGNLQIWHVGVRDENRKMLVPLFLRFSLRLGAVRRDLAGRVLLFR